MLLQAHINHRHIAVPVQETPQFPLVVTTGSNNKPEPVSTSAAQLPRLKHDPRLQRSPPPPPPPPFAPPPPHRPPIMFANNPPPSMRTNLITVPIQDSSAPPPPVMVEPPPPVTYHHYAQAPPPQYTQYTVPPPQPGYYQAPPGYQGTQYGSQATVPQNAPAPRAPPQYQEQQVVQPYGAPPPQQWQHPPTNPAFYR